MVSLQGVKQSDMDVEVDLSLNCLRLYADDAAFTASSECELQTLVTTWKEGCENRGLSLYASKTKVILVFLTFLKWM